MAKLDSDGQIIWSSYFLSDRSAIINAIKAMLGSSNLLCVSNISDFYDKSDIITPDAYQENNAGEDDLIIYVIGNNTVSTKEYTVKPLNIIPNPANDFLVIERPANLNGDISLEIFDTFGKLVSRESMDLGSNQVNISKLSSGIYFLNMVADNEYYRAKLIVE